VSTYLLAGLGDDMTTLIATCERLIQMGVYPFVVPFVPITGTPLQHHAAPSSQFMYDLYQQVGAMLDRAGMNSADIKAGCAKCGACSALPAFESPKEPQRNGINHQISGAGILPFNPAII
jgi:biotin synthase-related radical SAM superfamily protein